MSVTTLHIQPTKCASRVKKNQLYAQIIISAFRQLLHVSGVSRPIIRRYNRTYTTIRTYYSFFLGTAVAQWLTCSATNRKVAGSIQAGVSGFFIDIKILRSHYGPGIDSASNRNDYQEYFLGVKSGRCVRLTTLPPSCAVVTKSGNLNFLRTLWACPGQ